MDGIANFFGGLKDKVLGVFDSIIGGIKQAFNWVSDLWGKITAPAQQAASAQSYAQAYALPVRQYAMARSITPLAATAYATPNLTRAVLAARSAAPIRHGPHRHRQHQRGRSRKSRQRQGGRRNRQRPDRWARQRKDGTMSTATTFPKNAACT
ncbi:MAG: hypothetical protein ACLU1W_04880 [Collinsella sp.]